MADLLLGTANKLLFSALLGFNRCSTDALKRPDSACEQVDKAKGLCYFERIDEESIRARGIHGRHDRRRVAADEQR